MADGARAPEAEPEAWLARFQERAAKKSRWADEEEDSVDVARIPVPIVDHTPDPVPVPVAELTHAERMAYAFPMVDPGVTPTGSRVLVQLRRPPVTIGKGLIITTDYTRETDQDNEQVAMVLALGPLAFRSSQTGEVWPEGEWVKPGDFIRLAKHGGDRWETLFPPEGKDSDLPKVRFVILKDLDITGVISGDPLAFKAYV